MPRCEIGCQEKTLLHSSPCGASVVLASRTVFFLLERISVLTPGAPTSTAGIPIAVAGLPLSSFMQRFRTPIVAKRRKPSVGLVPTIILWGAQGLWLFWVIRGGIGLTRRLGADSSTRNA